MKKKTKKLIRDLKEKNEDLNELADKYCESAAYAEIKLLKKALSNADLRIKELDGIILNLKEADSKLELAKNDNNFSNRH